MQLSGPLARLHLFQPRHGGQRHLRAQRSHVHGVGRDGEIENFAIHGVVGFDPRLVRWPCAPAPARAAHGRGPPPCTPARNGQRRRIGDGQRRVVERQFALQAALAGIADGAVHAARQLQFGRKLRAHVARQFHQRRQRKPVPVHRHAPARLREIIGGAEAHRQRQRPRCRPSSTAVRVAAPPGPAGRGYRAASPAPAAAAGPSGARLRCSAAPECRCCRWVRPGAGARRWCRARCRSGRASARSTRPARCGRARDRDPRAPAPRTSGPSG